MVRTLNQLSTVEELCVRQLEQPTLWMTAIDEFAKQRLAIDMTALRQDLWRLPGEDLGEPSVQDVIPETCTDRLWWSCTKDMVADGLTKAMVWNDIIVDLTSIWSLFTS